MIKSIDITAFLSLFFLIPSISDSGLVVIKQPSSSEKTTGCGTFRNINRNNSLFQDVRVLSLNCDSTFSYRHSNCIHPETSEGTWSLKGNTVGLSTTNKVKRLAAKDKKTKEGYKYLDLEGVTLTFIDSFVIWKRTDKLTDTLQRQ